MDEIYSINIIGIVLKLDVKEKLGQVKGDPEVKKIKIL